MYNVIMVSCDNSYHNIRVRSYLSVLIKSRNIRQTNTRTFCCSSASLFCCTMTTRYSSHCFWNSATFFLASSNSTDMASTLMRVSSILNKPFLNLDTCSPSSSRFSDNNLRKKESFRINTLFYLELPLTDNSKMENTTSFKSSWQLKKTNRKDKSVFDSYFLYPETSSR